MADEQDRLIKEKLQRVLELTGRDSRDVVYILAYRDEIYQRMKEIEEKGCPEGKESCSTHTKEHQLWHLNDILSKVLKWQEDRTTITAERLKSNLHMLEKEFPDHFWTWLGESGLTQEDIEMLGTPECQMPYCDVRRFYRQITKSLSNDPELLKRWEKFRLKKMEVYQ